MKKYIKIYLEANGFQKGDFIPCEVCSKGAVDIHHIEPRGMGGSKKKDTPDNLIAPCRRCHVKAEQKKLSKEYLKEKHLTSI